MKASTILKLVAVMFAIALSGCASLDVETKYGTIKYDGKSIRVMQAK